VLVNKETDRTLSHSHMHMNYNMYLFIVMECMADFNLSKIPY